MRINTKEINEEPKAIENGKKRHLCHMKEDRKAMEEEN